MYVFALAAMLGLGVMVLALAIDRWMATFREVRPIAFLVFGIAIAWIADFDMWALWGQELRAEWISITLTGLVLSGLAMVWHELVALLASLYRKYSDEAETIERQHDLRRVA